MKRPAMIMCACALCLFTIPSCDTKEQEAGNYLESLVDLQEKVVRQMLELNKASESGDPELLESQYQTLVTTVDATLENARKAEPFDGSSKLRDALVKLFEFYQSIVKKEYREMTDIMKKETPSDEDIQRLNEITEDISKREAVLDAEVARSEDAFAKKYGLTLQKHELQDEIDTQ